MVVKQSGNTVVRLGEIADIELGAETYDDAVRFDGQTATFMGVWILPTRTRWTSSVPCAT